MYNCYVSSKIIRNKATNTTIKATITINVGITLIPTSKTPLPLVSPLLQKLPVKLY